ncbi:MASE1 domain-containing protein [Nonomuraea guangzhouensis]|uniref:MASE1 domain-containing protein n=1 Tax=Nonomuraea guangzhouensis TaxID=1291555 RepID=A0ABW4GB04_9ACTN|nr:MASE1 domain-containing protein [Nonomuraea guangzhouensis]
MNGLRVLAVAGAYFAAAKVGLQQELVGGQVTPLWPPTGIALACLLIMGVRFWPGITLGAFLVNLSLGPTLPAVVAISVGNTLAPVCAYLMLVRARFSIELDRLRDALALVFLGALIGMVISATVGSGALLLAGALRSSGFWSAWSVWWAGDAMGVLVITPVLLVLRTLRPPWDAPLSRWVEAVSLAVGTFLITLVATVSSINLLFLVFPFLIWAALRFQLAGAAACALIVSTVAIVAAAQGSGPFATHDLFLNMVTLQAFNGTASLTALLLAAIIAERNQAHDKLEQICARLTEVADRVERHRAAGQQVPLQQRTTR